MADDFGAARPAGAEPVPIEAGAVAVPPPGTPFAEFNTILDARMKELSELGMHGHVPPAVTDRAGRLDNALGRLDRFTDLNRADLAANLNDRDVMYEARGNLSRRLGGLFPHGEDPNDTGWDEAKFDRALDLFTARMGVVRPDATPDEGPVRVDAPALPERRVPTGWRVFVPAGIRRFFGG